MTPRRGNGAKKDLTQQRDGAKKDLTQRRNGATVRNGRNGTACACTAAAVLVALAVALIGCDRSSPPRDQRARTQDGAVAQSDVTTRTSLHMGTVFSVSIAGDGGDPEAIEAAFAEVERVEAAISSWRDDSDTSRVNRGAGGEAVAVGADLLSVVATALEVSRLTRGAFDITYAGCGHLWSTDPPRRPSEAELADCLPRVGWAQIELDQGGSTVRLSRPEARIGLGAIGKGYGIDRAAAVLRERGLNDFIVDGGGDVLTAGTRHGRPWRVGIQAPRGPRGQLMDVLEAPASGVAVATSGDYEQFVEQDGERIHHIIDPRSGRVAHGAIAVTVIAPDATRADAFATGLLVLGAVDGIAVVEGVEGVEALVIDEAGEAHVSSGFEDYLAE